jgi:hypothetical protein
MNRHRPIFGRVGYFPGRRKMADSCLPCGTNDAAAGSDAGSKGTSQARLQDVPTLDPFPHALPILLGRLTYSLFPADIGNSLETVILGG